MRYKNQLMSALLSLTLLFCSTGCGKIDILPPNNPNDGEVAQIKPSQNEHIFNFYNDYSSEIMLSLDQDGNIIPKEKQYTVMYDLLTQKPQCQTKERYEKIGEDPEFGHPIVKRLTALFDMDENMLFDYEEISYSQGFGDFIIKHNQENMIDIGNNLDCEERLINIKTGEVVLDGVGYLELFDKDKKELIACTWARRDILGIIDENATVISKLQQTDMKYSYPRVFEGMILAEGYKNDENGNMKPETKYVAFSREFEMLRSSPRLYPGYGQLKGDYLNETDPAGRQRIIDKDFNICYEFNTDGANYILQYFDGELAILNNRMSDGGVWSWELRDIKNNALAKEYTQISPIEEFESDTPAQSFIGVRYNEIHLLNRKGDPLFSKKVESTEMVSYIGGGYIAYGTYESAGLLDMELNEVIPVGKYKSFDRRYDGVYGISYKRHDDILIANYSLNNKGNVTRCDLLNSDLEIIMSAVSQVYGISEDRIAIERGFFRGLIDYNGNWVKKYSIFDDLKAEDKEMNTYW